jgi:enoyl-CoA hydratase
MSQPVLLVEKKEGVATLTLNRPSAMNALSRELRAALAREFSALRSDRETRAVILTGAGRAFCAGLDLVELGEAGRSNALDAGVGDNVADLLAGCAQPVIGAINGVAVTGGFELALACDVLIATPEARFADTHARVGILPGWGLSQKLARAVGVYRAKELSLTGNYLSAEQACDWGLVNRVVPAQELLPTCQALAQDMLSCVPSVMREYKRLIDRGHAMTLGDGLALEGEISRARNRSVTADQVAERRATIQQRGRKQSSA